MDYGVGGMSDWYNPALPCTWLTNLVRLVEGDKCRDAYTILINT